MNPYIQQQAQALQTDANNNLQRNILPGLRAGAMAAGGFGGSRQGIAQANAISQTQQGVAGQQANLYSNAYNTDANIAAQQAMQQAQLASQQNIAGMQNATQRELGLGQLDLGKQQNSNQYNLGLGNLGLGYQNSQNQYDLGMGGLSNQRYGMDQNYNLGMGNLGLGYQQANQNFYTNQRGQDLQQLGIGANLVGQGNTGLANQGGQLYQNGQAQQQAPWQALQQWGGALSPFSGMGGSTSQQTPGPTGLQSGIGGALTLAQLYQMMNGGKP